MLRKLLATTALVALVSTPALAQTQQPADDERGLTLYVIDVDTIGDADTRGFLASNLMGKYVYASTAEDAETVGDINDVVITEDGSVGAVIIGVGGFLGIGEKDVAVGMDNLTMTRTGDNELRVSTDLSREQLESAAGYERPDYIPDWRTRDENAEMQDQDRVAAADEQTADEPMTDRAAWMEGKTEIQNSEISADRLLGARVYDSKLDDIGEVDDVVMTADGDVDAAIVDVGGFLGIGEKPVALGFEELSFYIDESDILFVTVPYAREDFDAVERYEADTYIDNRDTMRLDNTDS